MKLFIVDDNDQFRRTLKTYLEEHLNYTVIGEASNGEEFIKEMNYSADIILMDINMPGINGIESVKKAIWYNHSLKFIAITQFQESVDLKTLIEAGFKGFVSKTNIHRDINNAIKSVVNGKLFFSDEMEIQK